jgi:hypothetical protein
LIHELAGFLVALGPAFFAHDLGLELGALAHGAVAVSITGRARNALRTVYLSML